MGESNKVIGRVGKESRFKGKKESPLNASWAGGCSLVNIERSSLLRSESKEWRGMEDGEALDFFFFFKIRLTDRFIECQLFARKF